MVSAFSSNARASCGRLAASRCRCRRSQPRTDAAYRRHGRARQVRHVLPGRRLCYGLRRAPFHHRQVRAADAARGIGHGHPPIGLAATGSIPSPTTWPAPSPRSVSIQADSSLERGGHAPPTYAKSATCFAAHSIRRTPDTMRSAELVKACGSACDLSGATFFVGDTQGSQPLCVRPGRASSPISNRKYFSIQGHQLDGPSDRRRGRPSTRPAPGDRARRWRRASPTWCLTAQENDLAEGQAYNGVKAQSEESQPRAPGRAVRRFPVVGRTEREAQAIFAELNRKHRHGAGFRRVSERLGADIDGLPARRAGATKRRAALLLAMARRQEKLTLRELFYRVAAARGLPADRPLPPQFKTGFPRRRRRPLSVDVAVLCPAIRRFRGPRGADPCRDASPMPARRYTTISAWHAPPTGLSTHKAADAGVRRRGINS